MTNSHNHARNISSNNEDKETSSEISQEELIKADHFYNSGALEEAKFWYRQSAQHGNQQAKKMCKKLKINY